MLHPTTQTCTPCPLMCAVKKSQHYAVKYFLARGFPLQFKDMNWRTVLHVAVACADIQTVDLILEVNRIKLELRWLKTASSTFQDVDFDGPSSLSPLFINMMLQSRYQKTAQSLVYTLVSFS